MAFPYRLLLRGLGYAFLLAIGCWSTTYGDEPTQPITKNISELLGDRCVGCHSTGEANGGVDLEQHISNFDPIRDEAVWAKVESAIRQSKMPPPDEDELTSQSRKDFSQWFTNQFVLPGGIAHPGKTPARRLTREELQNTLEDLLFVDIRATVTNSRLHVIPDTIVEKFFPIGVVGKSGFSNDAETLGQESINIQTAARCFAAVVDLLDSNREARKALFHAENVDELPADRSRNLIRSFGDRAFRRPMTNDELDFASRVFDDRVATGSTPYESFKSSLVAVLLNPAFLYRFEQPSDQPAPVSDLELATRLSYFLWSAPPDTELLDAAKNGTLRKTDELKTQVARMLADPKRIALAENLGGEWFDYKQLRQKSSVNKRSDKMAGFYRTQYEEALLFFDSIIRYDQPIDRLIDADWGFSNRHQSGIYGVSTPTKRIDAEPLFPPISVHFRSIERTVQHGNYEYRHAPLSMVQFNDTDRGGFVTLGPTMSVTSTENRTSPIRRGVWVMERILGEHFEAPADVPDLEETQKQVKSQKLDLTHNEILKMHSAQNGCAACHKYIDPVGFGLEAFDQLGVRRPVELGEIDGQKFGWNPKITPANKFADRQWALTGPLETGKPIYARFLYEKGGARLDVRNVRLESGEITLVDKHHGFTGGKRRDNVWKFQIPDDAPADGWTITAEIKGDGSSDSTGTITIGEPGPETKFRLPNGNEFSSPGELKQRLLLDYRSKIIDNAIHRVLAYALGRKTRPIDRPAIDAIREHLRKNDDRMNALIEAVVLSYPFGHKE